MVQGKRSSASNSISRRFRFINNLNGLTLDLGATEAHFIRCVKPNAVLQPRVFEQKLVLEQLRGSGVFDAVELMKAAYPSRIAYDDIYGKYAKLLPSELVGQLPPGPFCEVVALACDVGRDDYALGFARLFLRPGKGVFFSLYSDLTHKLPSLIPY